MHACRLALELAKSVGITLPTSTAANTVYESLLHDRGDDDFSAVHAGVVKNDVTK